MAEDTAGKSGKGKGSNDGREVAFEGDPAVQARIDAADHGASEGGARRSAGETIRDEAGKIGGQATDQLKSFASDGKARATDALDQFAKLLDRAAGDVDAKLGEQYGGYARQASSAVAKFSGQVRDRDVDDLFDEVGAFVRKSPGVAIGAAAALGFVVARVLQSSIDAGRDKA